MTTDSIRLPAMYHSLPFTCRVCFEAHFIVAGEITVLDSISVAGLPIGSDGIVRLVCRCSRCNSEWGVVINPAIRTWIMDTPIIREERG
jgi:hypothetical protein